MQSEIIVDLNYYIYFIGKYVSYYFTLNSFNKNLPEKHSYGVLLRRLIPNSLVHAEIDRTGWLV